MAKTTKGKRAPRVTRAAAEMRRLALADPVQPGVTAPGVTLDRAHVVSLRVTDLAEPVGRRVTLTQPAPSIVRRDLLRYYAILEDARPMFGAADLEALRRACAGVSFESPGQVAALWAFATMVFGEGHALVARLRGAPLAMLYAVVDLMESGPLPSVPSVPSVPAEPAETDASAREGGTDG